MAGEYDLLIVNGDFAFGPDGEPRFLKDADVVAQDVGTRVRASGLATELVGDDEELSATLRRIEQTVEDDERVKPGTAKAEQTAPETITVTAETMDGTPITA